MTELPFRLDLIQFLIEHRSGPLTKLFQLLSFMGEVEGYILVTTLIFVACDKGLAYRLSILVLLTMTLNHFLKVLIRNPRPFITEGTYAEKWAVSAENARELATEYSTPSGHAMAAAAFYGYLYASVRNARVRTAAVLAILLTGLSRPYLGVHYFEDIGIGWMIGLSLILLLWGLEPVIRAAWCARSHAQQVGLVVAGSLALWLATIEINGGSVDDQPLAFMGYAGFLTGIVTGYPLELKTTNFDPRRSNILIKTLRYALTVGLVLCTLLFLDTAFTLLSNDASTTGHLLKYLRYAIAGVVATFIAPVVFTRLGLAETFAPAA